MAPRRLGVVLLTAALLVTIGPAATAHPIGGRSDLPVPAGLFAAITGAALVATFVFLTLSWPQPRLQELRQPTVTGGRTVAVLGPLLTGVGLLSLGLVVLAGVFDGDDAAAPNAAPVLVFIGFWLVVPMGSVLVGDWWRWLSPWRTASRLLNRRVPERAALVDRFGVWPATVAMLAFAWMTQVSPSSARATSLAVAAVAYAGYVVVASRFTGTATGLRVFDAFHTTNALMGAMAPIEIAEDEERRPGAIPRSVIAHHGWLRRLAAVPAWRGLPALLGVLIGGVAYDGLNGTELWIEAVGQLRLELWFATLTLVAVVAAVIAVYAATSWWGARLVGGEAGQVAARFAHVLVPVALAYMVAHYFTLVLYEGQLALPAASDPFGRGWDLFGTSEWEVVAFMDPVVIWVIQVAVMAAGHATALILAHDRALADYGPRGATRIQYAMLTLIVALASLGLFLLSG